MSARTHSEAGDEVNGAKEHPSEAVSDVIRLKLRRSWKMASISHFVGLYAQFIPLAFSIHQLELDLDQGGPDVPLVCIPVLLGKLLNTLANDRNVK